MVVAAVLLTAAGCATAVYRPLPAFEGGLACRDVGFDAVLAGDPQDPRVAWLIDRTDGSEIEVTWPPGAYARFADHLEVRLADGTLFYREGDVVDGGCHTSDRGPWAIKYSRSGTLPNR